MEKLGDLLPKNSDVILNLRSLTVKCPICGKEFGCNKNYHVYTALVSRKRQYYCSYSCYKKRPNPKEKR
jgi:hypothetical protein